VLESSFSLPLNQALEAINFIEILDAQPTFQDAKVLHSQEILPEKADLEMASHR
jgi:hypothetical protein